VADEYLRAFGLTLFGWAWCRIARAAAMSTTEDPWCEEALNAASYGIQWLLPEAAGRWQRIKLREVELPAIPARG
jgi:hypothetical protein